MPSTGAALAKGVDIGALSSGFRGAIGGLEIFPTALSSTQLLGLATAAPVTCGSTSGKSGSSGGTSSAPPTTTAAVQASSSLRSWAPSSLRSGTSTRVGAQMTSPSGAVARARVYLFVRRPGHPTWVRIAVRHTSAAGYVRATIRPTHSNYYVWKYRGSAAYHRARSDWHKVTLTVHRATHRHHTSHHRAHRR